jgi:hypothetical protein
MSKFKRGDKVRIINKTAGTVSYENILKEMKDNDYQYLFVEYQPSGRIYCCGRNGSGMLKLAKDNDDIAGIFDESDLELYDEMKEFAHKILEESNV